MSRSLSLAYLVKDIKVVSGAWYRSKLKCGFYWQVGYGAFSIDISNLEKVTNYIMHQEEHHKHRTFQEEYLTFLSHYGIAYDEMHLWD